MTAVVEGIVDGFQRQVKRLLSRDEIQIDNFIFKLHHTYNFVIIVVGLIFITSQNYFSDNAITCISGNDYVNNYCFLHGAAHIPSDIQGMLSPKGSRCIAEQNKEEDEIRANERTTNYYIWLPFILTICAIICKTPEIIWKNLFERGMMKKLVTDSSTDKEDALKKNAKRFYKISLKNSWQAPFYNFGFAFCECLNILAVFINRHILNLLFMGKYSDYGNKATEYFSFEYDAINTPMLKGPHNPLCNLFPTEVSCTVRIGGISGKQDVKNTLCLLANNVFNQYFFLILWWWWVILISVSCIGLIYRLAQLGIGSFGKAKLTTTLNMLAITKQNQNNLAELEMGPSEIFLFSRLAVNLKGSQVTSLIEAITSESKIKTKEKKIAEVNEESKEGMEMTDGVNQSAVLLME